MSANLIRSLIRDVPDFPSPGIVFKDITPLLASPEGLQSTIDLMAETITANEPQALVGIESRGFIFAAALATKMGLPMHLVRKPGKLPHDKVGLDYELEYGSDRLEMHRDAVQPGTRYAIVDDVLATGGTASAAARLVEQQGGVIACCVFLMELEFLKGRSQLGSWSSTSLINY